MKKLSLIVFLFVLLASTLMIKCRDKYEPCPEVTITTIHASFDSIAISNDFDTTEFTRASRKPIFQIIPHLTLRDTTFKTFSYHQNKISIFPSAYATPPCPHDWRKVDISPTVLDSVAVFTDKIYNRNAGRDVTDLCVGTFDFQPIQYSYFRNSEVGITLSDFLESEEDERGKLFVSFFEPPDQSDTFKITVRLFDTAGIVYQKTSESIFIPRW